MTRRRSHKRSRQKAKFHKVQKSLRKNVQLDNARNGDKERSDLPDSHTPESVLFESQHMDPLCDNQLSPEIIPMQPRTRSEGTIKDDADNEIPMRMIEQSSPISSKLDLLMCDFKHGTKCMNNVPNLENFGERERDVTKLIIDDQFDLMKSYSFNLSSLSNEPNNADVTYDRRSLRKTVDETACRNTSGSAISHPNSESQSRGNVCTFVDAPGPASSNEKGSFGRRASQQKDHCTLETIEDCYLLNKTLLINDNLVREINKDLNGRSMGRDRVSELPHLGFIRKTDERGEVAQTLVCRSISGPRDNPDRKRGTSNGNKRLNVALDRIGECLTTNWREFRKIFAYLRWTFKRACGEDFRGEPLLHGYRRYPNTSISTLSVFRSPSSSPRWLKADDPKEAEGTKREPEKAGIPPDSTTPRMGLVKRCRRMTLTFGDEGEAARNRPPASRADITDPLPEGKKKDKGRSFLRDPLSLSNETRQDGRVPELTIVPDVEPSDRDGSWQKVHVSFIVIVIFIKFIIYFIN